MTEFEVNSSFDPYIKAPSEDELRLSSVRKQLRNLRKKRFIKEQLLRDEKEKQAQEKARKQSKLRVEEKLLQFVNPSYLDRKKTVEKEIGRLYGILRQKDRGAIKISNLQHLLTVSELGSALEERSGSKVRLLNLCNKNKENFDLNYAYVYFSERGVAKKMAEKMNNSIFFNKVVKVSFIEPQKLKANMFRSVCLS